MLAIDTHLRIRAASEYLTRYRLSTRYQPPLTFAFPMVHSDYGLSSVVSISDSESPYLAHSARISTNANSGDTL